MRSRLTSIFMTVAVVTATGGAAMAQGDSGGTGTDPAAPADPTSGDSMPATPAADDANPREEARFGVGVSLRRVVVPKVLIELFVEQAGTSVAGTGFRAELYRRRGDFELQLGFEFENLKGDPGIWVDKGDNPGPTAGDEVDYVEFDNFGWFSIEVTFLNHTKFSKNFALRYGGGAGIAILKGDIRRTDYACSVDTLDPETLRNTCDESPTAVNRQTPYDLPPVFPIINAMIGLQIRPTESLLINIECGIRTIPFFGGTIGYLF